MQNLTESIDAILHCDNSIRQGATQYLIRLIMNKPSFYISIFNEFHSIDNIIHKKLCLIILKRIISINFPVINQNFQQFSETLNFSISSTKDLSLLRIFSGIICDLSSKFKDPWPDLQNYLLFYQNDIIYIQFCIDILKTCFCDKYLHRLYGDFIQEIQFDMIFHGLQCQLIDAQIDSCFLFSVFTLEFNKIEQLSPFKNYSDLIISLAHQSLTFSEFHFNIFWSAILNINDFYAEPLYVLVRKILLENNNFSPHTRSILLQFIIHHSKYLQIEEIEPLIGTYFNLQLEVDDIDNTGLIFFSFKKFSEIPIYQLFKRYLVGFMTSQSILMQKVGLTMLENCLFLYIYDSFNDWSDYIDIVLQIVFNSHDFIFLALGLFSQFLDSNMLSFQDCNKIFDFILKVIFIPNNSLQNCELECVKALPPDPIFFDKLIDIYPSVPFESLPVYYMCLYNIHSDMTNLSKEKYENFIDTVIQTYININQQVTPNLSNFKTLKANQRQMLYNLLVLLGSAINLIFYFSFFDPIKLKINDIQPIIASMVQIISISDALSDIETPNSIGLDLILHDFYQVCLMIQPYSIEFILPFSNEIIDESSCFYFTKLFALTGPANSSYTNQIIEDLDDILKIMNDKSLTYVDYASYASSNLIFLSKVAYKISEIFVKKTLKLIQNGFLISERITQLLPLLVKSLVYILKPASIAAKQGDVFSQQTVDVINIFATKTCEKKLPKLGEFITQVFNAVYSLMEIFILSDNNFGHAFFSQQVFPIYLKYQIIFESVLLKIFVKMLINNYCLPEELGIIKSTVENIMQRGDNYKNDSCFYILMLLSKFDPSIINEYLPKALNLFQEAKNDFSQKVSVIQSYSIFILFSFNQDPETLQPISHLIPDVLSYFPIENKKVRKSFLDVLFDFIGTKRQFISREICVAIIAAFVRYFSYQTNAALIFYFTQEQNMQLLNTLKDLLNTYVQDSPETDVGALISSFIPEQPNSINYVMSLLQM